MKCVVLWLPSIHFASYLNSLPPSWAKGKLSIKHLLMWKLHEKILFPVKHHYVQPVWCAKRHHYWSSPCWSIQLKVSLPYGVLRNSQGFWQSTQNGEWWSTATGKSQSWQISIDDHWKELSPAWKFITTLLQIISEINTHLQNPILPKISIKLHARCEQSWESSHSKVVSVAAECYKTTV